MTVTVAIQKFSRIIFAYCWKGRCLFSLKRFPFPSHFFSASLGSCIFLSSSALSLSCRRQCSAPYTGRRPEPDSPKWVCKQVLLRFSLWCFLAMPFMSRVSSVDSVEASAVGQVRSSPVGSTPPYLSFCSSAGSGRLQGKVPLSRPKTCYMMHFRALSAERIVRNSQTPPRCQPRELEPHY